MVGTRLLFIFFKPGYFYSLSPFCCFVFSFVEKLYFIGSQNLKLVNIAIRLFNVLALWWSKYGTICSSTLRNFEKHPTVETSLLQVCTFHDGCKQGIDQEIFNRKSISRKITHPLSWKLQAMLTGEKLKGWSNCREKTNSRLQSKFCNTSS